METLTRVTVALIRHLRSRAYLLLAVVFTFLILGDFGLLRSLGAAETRLFDSLISHRFNTPKADPDIVILDIDEASLAALSKDYGRWPWPNQVLGDMVTALEKQKPKAIVFDILFSDRDSQRPQSDAAFFDAIAHSSTTFFSMLRLNPENDHLSKIPVGALPGAKAMRPDADGSATIAMILPKVPPALDNGRLGTHQVMPDQDGIVRRYPGWVDYAGWRIPSLPERIAQEFAYPGADHRDVLLNWRGPPFTYHYVSFSSVYSDLVLNPKAVAQTTFKDKIIVIGSTAPSLFDVKGSPVARIHPGVEILATAIDNFKHGDGLRERPRWVLVAGALLLIWSMAFALYRQVRIEVFDSLFGGLQAGLIAIAYLVVNFSPWYLDTSAPVSLGLMYFAAARLYYGLSWRWLANAQVRDMRQQTNGRRLLAVMAVHLPDAAPAALRALKGELDRQVAQSRLGASRIAHLVEDPGLVQSMFADTMLVYWLLEDMQSDWASDATAIQSGLRGAYAGSVQATEIGFGLACGEIAWSAPRGWANPGKEIIVSAIVRSIARRPAKAGAVADSTGEPQRDEHY